jgi:PhzF family phenazine biosynthesis protein
MLPIHIVDAFTNRRFAGNPAAVVILQDWLDDAHLQSIAAENNLAETAFILREGDIWHLRWFTPMVEVPICGHATLASAWVIFNRLLPESTKVTFSTRKSGLLHVEQVGDRLIMDFPAEPPRPSVLSLTAMLGAKPAAVLETDRRLMAVFDDASTVRALTPDMAAIVACGVHGLIVTAPGDDSYDCVSRFFAPGAGIPEDPVTGGAHCVLTPYWTGRLGKPEIRAFQASPRGGEMTCRMRGDRVELEGQCVPYLTGQIEVGI